MQGLQLIKYAKQRSQWTLTHRLKFIITAAVVDLRDGSITDLVEFRHEKHE